MAMEERNKIISFLFKNEYILREEIFDFLKNKKKLEKKIKKEDMYNILYVLNFYFEEEYINIVEKFIEKYEAEGIKKEEVKNFIKKVKREYYNNLYFLKDVKSLDLIIDILKSIRGKSDIKDIDLFIIIKEGKISIDEGIRFIEENKIYNFVEKLGNNIIDYINNEYKVKGFLNDLVELYKIIDINSEIMNNKKLIYEKMNYIKKLRDYLGNFEDTYDVLKAGGMTFEFVKNIDIIFNLLRDFVFKKDIYKKELIMKIIKSKLFNNYNIIKKEDISNYLEYWMFEDIIEEVENFGYFFYFVIDDKCINECKMINKYIKKFLNIFINLKDIKDFKVIFNKIFGEGSNEEKKNLYINNCKNLKNFIGLRKGFFNVISVKDCNNLESLKGIPNDIKELVIEKCNIENLEGLSGRFKKIYVIDCLRYKGIGETVRGIESLYYNNMKMDKFDYYGCEGKEINNIFIYESNLKNLEGMPKGWVDKIGIRNSNLESLKGIAKKVKEINLRIIKGLEDFSGCEDIIVNDFICFDVSVKNLKGSPKNVKYITLESFYDLESLEGMTNNKKTFIYIINLKSKSLKIDKEEIKKFKRDNEILSKITLNGRRIR